MDVPDAFPEHGRVHYGINPRLRRGRVQTQDPGGNRRLWMFLLILCGAGQLKTTR